MSLHSIYRRLCCSRPHDRFLPFLDELTHTPTGPLAIDAQDRKIGSSKMSHATQRFLFSDSGQRFDVVVLRAKSYIRKSIFLEQLHSLIQQSLPLFTTLFNLLSCLLYTSNSSAGLWDSTSDFILQEATAKPSVSSTIFKSLQKTILHKNG